MEATNLTIEVSATTLYVYGMLSGMVLTMVMWQIIELIDDLITATKKKKHKIAND